LPDEDCVAYDTAIRASGHCIASEALQSVQTATTVRVRNGKVAVTDGPFAETKEQLAGFYMIEARDLNEAIPARLENPAGARGQHRSAGRSGLSARRSPQPGSARAIRKGADHGKSEKTASRKPRRTLVLVATRKGAWLYHGDAARKTWRADGPHFLGHVVSHLVLDPRDRRTLLAAAKTGHLGPTVFRSTDLGRTWKEAARPPAFARPPTARAVRSITPFG